MQKQIKITVAPGGTFEVDLTGFQGVGCADVLKAFDGIGTKVKESKKPEYHQKEHKIQCK